MKQGNASRSGPGGQKVEPTPHAINPAGVSQIGETVDKKAIESFNQGRGYKAPMSGRTIHHAGSQGKHQDD
jgi:hypothetical protein